MNYLIYDLAIVVLLFLFALWGRHRGLILSIFSLVALLVAITGGFIVSNLLTPTVAEWVQPMVEDTVVSAVQSALPENAVDVLGVDGKNEQNIPDDGFSLESVQDYLEEAGVELPEQIQTFLDQLGEEKNDAPISVEELTAAAVKQTTETIVRVVLFLLAFVLILILWHLLARALDLVSRLPGLNALNKLGGFLFGAVRGVLILFVAAWVLQWYPTTINTLIPAETIEQTHLLKFFLTAKPLEILAFL